LREVTVWALAKVFKAHIRRKFSGCKIGRISNAQVGGNQVHMPPSAAHVAAFRYNVNIAAPVRSKAASNAIVCLEGNRITQIQHNETQCDLRKCAHAMRRKSRHPQISCSDWL
jgi:hypothetical protein